MIVTADEVNRSLKGAIDLLHSRAEGLKAFDLSERGFWRSFNTIWLALPAYVVTLALVRLRLGVLQPDQALFGSLHLDLLVGLAYGASFLSLPVAMIWISRALRLTDRYVPFVIVTNWISVVGLLTAAFPGLLILIGWATPALAQAFAAAFAVLLLRMQWFATKATLGVSGSLACGIVVLGVGLNALVACAVRGVIG